MTNGNKWIAITGGWLFVIIVVITLPALANNMIKNDRIRASEDQRIEDKFEEAIQHQHEKIDYKLDKLITSQMIITERIVKIEAKIE